MNIGKMIMILILSAITGFAGACIGGAVFGTDEGLTMLAVIGFMIPAVCLIADMHSKK
ncbi:MAG: hypothetical protein VB031_04495 [Eubacteriaceae bacterium]|nr:hypothetical protein [Eubacteriaceae bacterium]